jgi:hypothetical protein
MDMAIVEKLNSIKYKLNKYSNTNNNDKINVYLNALNNIQNIDQSVLKETEIVNCLKTLKKSNDHEISQLSGEIISKWKKICLEKSTSRSTELKNEPQIPVKIEDTNDASKRQKLSINDYKAKSVKQESQLYNSPLPAVTKVVDRKNEMYKETVNTTNTTINKLPITVPKPTEPLANLFTNSRATTAANGTTRSFSQLPAIDTSSLLSQTKHVNTQEEDDEYLNHIMKNRKTKYTLYTGKKAQADGVYTVPKLYDLAVKSLIESLDDLPNRISIYNTINDFPIAFELIKPVIERTNAKQLQSIEYYSPNLCEDTDYIWKKIYEQEFKNAIGPGDDDITWRDFYIERLNERQKKFDSVRNRISAIQANKPKERVTQMATVKFTANGRPSSSYASNKSSSSSSSAPVRQLLRESSQKKSNGNFDLNVKKSSFARPAESKGMKAASKLIKAFRR